MTASHKASGSVLAIEKLKKRSSRAPGQLNAFVAKHSFPIVEGGSWTFVFRGEADRVSLRHWIYGLPSSQPLARLAETDLWHLTMELPRSSRVEYKFEVTRGGETRWIQDPLNPLVAHDPFGANSVCQGEGYEVPDWTQPDPDSPPGRVEDRVFESRALGGSRQVSLYLPARYRPSRRCPLLVVHDGIDYLRYASLQTVLDNLIHRLEIPGMIVALIHPGERLEEYAASPAHARFLADELVPKLEQDLSLLSTPEGRGLMGASLGGVAALFTAACYPGRFGRLLLQSGSFAFADIGDHRHGPLFDPVARFINGYRADADPRAVSERVFVSCGTHESLIYENRSLLPVLESTGMEIKYVEAPDGHNWENWRDRLRQGLSWLFPGPLWMVYD
jgi:enterochelin esterase family protein